MNYETHTPGYFYATKFDTFDKHYNYVIMGAMASQIASFEIVCSTGYSGTGKKQTHQRSASLAFVW